MLLEIVNENRGKCPAIFFGGVCEAATKGRSNRPRQGRAFGRSLQLHSRKSPREGLHCPFCVTLSSFGLIALLVNRRLYSRTLINPTANFSQFTLCVVE